MNIRVKVQSSNELQRRLEEGHAEREMLQAAFADFDFFRSLHPALTMLGPEGALRAGLVAPQHRGLQQYLEVRAQYGGIEALD